ncbi:MAG TPA: BlaI/MecI/CopY family transcriptional regulator [Pirellulales bacterium]
MTKINEEVTDAELSVLEVLWKHPDGVPVRDIVLAVYGRHEHSLHGGVKSFLDRLTEKGLVRVDKTGFAHQFFATITQQQFVGQHLKKLADSHFGGSLAPLLLSLLDQTKLSRKDRAAIEMMIDKMGD